MLTVQPLITAYSKASRNCLQYSPWELLTALPFRIAYIQPLRIANSKPTAPQDCVQSFKIAYSPSVLCTAPKDCVQPLSNTYSPWELCTAPQDGMQSLRIAYSLLELPTAPQPPLCVVYSPSSPLWVVYSQPLIHPLSIGYSTTGFHTAP